jgi:thiamine-phosphate pyrophosphorylase
MASRPKQPNPRPAPRIYLVTPPLAEAASLTAGLRAALAAADVAAVLVRLAEADERTLINHAKALAPAVQDNGAALLLDGHPDLVARSAADGAHVSGVDVFAAASAQLKPDRIVGIGGLTSRDDAMRAAEAGADYLMYGEPHGRDRNLASIVERVSWCTELFELPCVAYAMTAEEIGPLVAAGADFVALDYVWTDERGLASALADAGRQVRLPEKTA